MKKRRVYSLKSKQQSVHLTRQAGASVAGVARDLGVDANTLSKWRHEEKQHGEQSFPGKGRSHDEELARECPLAPGTGHFTVGIGYCTSVPR